LVFERIFLKISLPKQIDFSATYVRDKANQENRYKKVVVSLLKNGQSHVSQLWFDG
jgi:hypothetical protein